MLFTCSRLPWLDLQLDMQAGKIWQVREVMRMTLHRLLDTAGKGSAAMLSDVCMKTPANIRLDVVKVTSCLPLLDIACLHAGDTFAIY